MCCLWERTFDALPDFITIIDTQYRIVRANKAMADCLGRTPAACVGIPCYQAVHGLDAPPLFCPHQQVVQDRQTHTAEVFEEGLGSHFLVTVSPLFSTHGSLAGSVHIAQNIDEQTGNNPAQKPWLMATGFLTVGVVVDTSHIFPTSASIIRRIQPTQKGARLISGVSAYPGSG